MLRPITEKVHSGNGPVSLVPIALHRVSSFQTYFSQNGQNALTKFVFQALDYVVP